MKLMFYLKHTVVIEHGFQFKHSIIIFGVIKHEDGIQAQWFERRVGN